MNFLLYLLIAEDIFVILAICMLLYLRERLYIITAAINVIILISVNVIMFQGNYYGLLLLVPLISFTITTSIIRPFVRQKPRITLNAQNSRFVVYLFLFIILLLIVLSIVLFVLSKR